MSATYPLPRFLNTFFQTISNSCLFVSISSSPLPDQQNDRQGYREGCNTASCATCLCMLHVLDRFCVTFFPRTVENKTASRAPHPTSSFKHVLNHAFNHSSCTASSAYTISSSFSKALQYVPWEHNINRDYCTIFDTSGLCIQLRAVSQRLVKFRSLFFFTGSALTVSYCTLCECHFPLALQCQWAGWAHCLPASFSHTNSFWSNMIATTPFRLSKQHPFLSPNGTYRFL